MIPQRHIEILEDGIKLNLGQWVSNIRNSRKGKRIYTLTQKMVKQLDGLGFSWNAENLFDKFYRYALLYKKKYGHTNIKRNDKIDGYNIGSAYNDLIKKYKKDKLTDKMINLLKNIDIDITKSKYDRQFHDKMEIARQAVSEGVIITNKNNVYKNVNFYQWYTDSKDKFTKEELEIMKKLLPYRKERICIQNKNTLQKFPI